MFARSSRSASCSQGPRRGEQGAHGHEERADSRAIDRELLRCGQSVLMGPLSVTVSGAASLAGLVGCAVGGRGNFDSVAHAGHIDDSALMR